MHTVILAAFVSLALFFGWHSAQAGQSSSRGKVLFLDTDALNLLLQSDPNLLLIDVRAPEELTGPLGRIPQSRNVTMQEIEKNPEQLPRDKTLVLISRTGRRSLKAAQLLAAHGYIVYTVNGGMKDWQRQRPPAPTPTMEAPSKKPPVPGANKDIKKPSEKHFFDSNMGC